MTVRSVYRHEPWHTRYLICDSCGAKGQHVLLENEVPKRRSFLKQTGNVQATAKLG